jgi:ribosomal protein S18 acetylase RimI-like enzyme
MTNHVQVLFEIKEESMHLECISTYSEDRKKGHGSEIMNIAIELADETNTTVTLQVANVTGNGYNMGQHPVIGAGMNKKDKILTSALPRWYAKFGFTKSPSYTQKKRDMIYTPKKK